MNEKYEQKRRILSNLLAFSLAQRRKCQSGEMELTGD